MNSNTIAEQQKEKKFREALEEMSKEELIQALMASIKQLEEIAPGARGLLQHLKVLCYRNGGTITYTKDEFKATVEYDPDFFEDYGMEEGKEVCILQVKPQEQMDGFSPSN